MKKENTLTGESPSFRPPLSKRLPLQAYLLVRDLATSEYAALKEAAAEVDKQFEGQTDRESLKRRVFVNLVLAELSRSDITSLYRAKVKDLGPLIALGEHGDPYPFYMNIIKHTTRAISTGDLGDLNPEPGPRLDNDDDLFYKALGFRVHVSFFDPWWEPWDFIGVRGFRDGLECDDLFRD